MPAPLRFLLAVVLAVVAVGCHQDDPIRAYTVPKETKPGEDAGDVAEFKYDPVDGPDKMRMLVTVVPSGDGYFWAVRFFAPAPVVDHYEADYDSFIASIKLPANSNEKPTYTMPKGWRTGTAPSAMAANLRVGTLHTGPKAKPVEMYLASPVRDDLLGNVNRWRVQFVGLPETTAADLKGQVKEVMVDGKPATRVDLRGPGVAGGGGMKPPFAPK